MSNQLFDSQRFSKSAWELYGPYLEIEPDDFIHGVESKAGRALVSALTRVLEIGLMDGAVVPETVDDNLARFTVMRALEHGHASIQDFPDTFKSMDLGTQN